MRSVCDRIFLAEHVNFVYIVLLRQLRGSVIRHLRYIGYLARYQGEEEDCICETISCIGSALPPEAPRSPPYEKNIHKNPYKHKQNKKKRTKQKKHGKSRPIISESAKECKERKQFNLNYKIVENTYQRKLFHSYRMFLPSY